MASEDTLVLANKIAETICLMDIGGSHQTMEALKASSAATMHVVDGELVQGAEEFERAARLCRMAAEARRWKKALDGVNGDHGE